MGPSFPSRRLTALFLASIATHGQARPPLDAYGRCACPPSTGIAPERADGSLPSRLSSTMRW